MIISRNPSPPLPWHVIIIFPACWHLVFTTSPTCQLTMIGAQHIHWRMGEIVVIWKAFYTDGAPLTGGCYLQQTTCAYSSGGLGWHVHLRAFSAPPRLATVTQMTLVLWYCRLACWCKYMKHADRCLILWSLHIVTWNKIDLGTRPAPRVVAIFRRSLEPYVPWYGINFPSILDCSEMLLFSVIVSCMFD